MLRSKKSTFESDLDEKVKKTCGTFAQFTFLHPGIHSISLHPPNSFPCELLVLRTSLGPEPWCGAAMVSRS